MQQTQAILSFSKTKYSFRSVDNFVIIFYFVISPIFRVFKIELRTVFTYLYKFCIFSKFIINLILGTLSLTNQFFQ